jgi:aspartyl-tRNA(Asn)/glutamyl-tRNA(Gln) amidotransferase subunit A
MSASDSDLPRPPAAAGEGDLHYLTAAAARELFAARKLSPVELMAATIARIEDVDPVVNALPIRFFDQALQAARLAEERFAGRHGGPRPLEGIPVAVKDEVEVAGQPCTAGSLVFKDMIAEVTAASVQRVIDAGAIIHARSATPEFCCAAITESRLWGVTRNPWNPAFSPGGSSGGSGAALAAGMATLATGSDIGGSIRIPASFCGVVGYKPPYGRVPQMPPFNLDHYCHEGPMARSVDDCRLLENVMAGPHPEDIASLRPKLTIPAELPAVAGMSIACSVDLGGFDVGDEVVAAVRRAAATFRELGATVDEVALGWSLDDMREAARAHLAVIFGSWIGTILEQHRDLLTPYAVEFAEDAVDRPNVGFLRSLEIEGETYDHLAAVFERYDLLICPVFTEPALPAAGDYDIDVVFDRALTFPFNMLSRCPALVVPAARAASGVPIGLQIVGRTYDDETVFAAATAFERTHRWYESNADRPDWPRRTT